MFRTARVAAVGIAIAAGLSLQGIPAWSAGQVSSFVPAGQGRWLKAESPRFTVYSDGDEGLLRDYVVKLELFDAILRHLHGMPLDEAPPRKLPIFLIRDRAQFEVVWPQITDGVRGFYMSSAGEIFAMATRSRDDNTVVQHEYVHHFMLQYFPYGYPAWLVEGYAEFFGSAKVEGGQIVVGRNEGRGGNLLQVGWVPIEKVLSKRPFELSGTDASMFYAEAWLMTHYFMSDPTRYAQLTAYMKAVGGGADPVAAMREVSGLTPEALQVKLRAYANGQIKFTEYTVKDIPTPPIAIAPLPAAASDLLLADLFLRRRGLERDEDDGAGQAGKTLEAKAAERTAQARWEAGFLADVRARAARHPDDPLAQRVLARAELALGDEDKGLALIDAFTAAHPSDAEGFEIAGLARLATGDARPKDQAALYKAAGLLLGKAYKLDPSRYQTLYAYARSRSLDPNYPTDNVLAALEEAHGLAPQVAEITLQTARALMMRERDEQAAALLAPVANSPHGGSAAAQARDLLKTIAERGAGKT